jgi:hypothetical protein
LIYCLLLEFPRISTLEILSKELSNSLIFARIDIFKIVKTKKSKNKTGIKESIEMLLKIKNK